MHGPQRKKVGDIEKGFADADVVVDGEYFTQVQTHSALETHGFVVDWKQEEVTVYASTQGTASVRDEFAEVFKLPKSQVRVITEYMGGGFGAKFGAGNEGVVAANLSRKAKAPVKLMLDRRQEHIACNRPDSHQKLKIGAKKDGTLTAIVLTSYGTAGVGTGAGTAGPATNMYKCPNLLTEEYDVFINAGPGAAFRAPGHPQGCFAFEQAIDELAVKLDMDPMALRDKIDENPARRVERKIIRERTNWKDRKPAGADNGPVKRGMGIAQSVWYRFVNMDSSCEVRVSRDGSVELTSSVQDLGTGTKTLLAIVVAEEFGIPPARHCDSNRRYAIPDRAQLRRQRDRGLDHSSGAQCFLPGETEIVFRSCSEARDNGGKSGNARGQSGFQGRRIQVVFSETSGGKDAHQRDFRSCYPRP